MQGHPTIDTVLRAFHTFARDTLLVAHNPAFAMAAAAAAGIHTLGQTCLAAQKIFYARVQR